MEERLDILGFLNEIERVMSLLGPKGEDSSSPQCEWRRNLGNETNRLHKVSYNVIEYIEFC